MLILFRLLGILLASIIFPCKHLLSKINGYIFHRVPFKKTKENITLNKITWLYSVEKIDSSQRDGKGKNVSEGSAVSHPRMQQR